MFTLHHGKAPSNHIVTGVILFEGPFGDCI